MSSTSESSTLKRSRSPSQHGSSSSRPEKKPYLEDAKVTDHSKPSQPGTSSSIPVDEKPVTHAEKDEAELSGNTRDTRGVQRERGRGKGKTGVHGKGKEYKGSDRRALPRLKVNAGDGGEDGDGEGEGEATARGKGEAAVEEGEGGEGKMRLPKKKAAVLLG